MGLLYLPLIKTTPNSWSTFKTCLCWMVFECPPILPAIRFPGYTRDPPPWDWPAEPIARWVKELPWEAGWPAHPWRFIPCKKHHISLTRRYVLKLRERTPANPFPLHVAQISTYCPSTKWSALIMVPGAKIPFSSFTLNSLIVFLGATPNFS